MMRTILKLTWIELKLFIREPLSLAMALGFPILVQVVMAGVFGVDDPRSRTLFKGVIGIDYYTPSSIAVVIAALGLIFLPLRLTTYRERGVLRRFHKIAAVAFDDGAIYNYFGVHHYFLSKMI